MAVCKRCKTTFNYEKREGVCPKCCFYNRPAGTWQEDQSWVKNYNYDDNSYTPPTYEEMDGYEDKNIFGRGGKWSDALERGRHREVSGSHKHTEDGRILKGSSAVSRKGGSAAPKSAQPKANKQKNVGCLSVGFVIFWIYIIIIFLTNLLSR